MELVPIAVSALEKFWQLATISFYVQRKLDLGDQSEDLQGLKNRYPHLRSLQIQGYNIKEFQVILGQNCYDIRQPLERKNSTVNGSVGGEIESRMVPYQRGKQQLSIREKVASQLSKWRDMESYASNKLWCHRLIDRWKESNQGLGANNLIYRWRIRNWTSLLRRPCEVIK